MSQSFVRQLIRRFFNSIGIDIRLISNLRNAEAISWEQKQDAMWQPFLDHLDIRTVIDVGANSGQFAKLIHRQCPQAKIISVEPLESCHEELATALKDKCEHHIIKAAAGDSPGVVTINESEYSPCSSLLGGTILLGEDYQAAAVTKQIVVPVVRLDDELTRNNLENDLLIKFDIQGYEIPAFRGSEELLKKAKIVVCEVCFFRKLYEGQPLFHEIYKELRKRGFTYMGNAEYLKRKSDGRNVEADAIFERLVDLETGAPE